MPRVGHYSISREKEVVASTAQSGEGDRFQTGRVITLSVGHAVHDAYASFLAPLLPAFIAKLALSKTQAGVLSFLQSSPSLLQPFIGYLADRVSLRYIVILAPAVTATMMSLLGTAPRYGVLALFLTVVGISSAAFHSAAPVAAGRLAGRSLGRGMGVWMMGGSLGFGVGPILIVSAVNILGLEGTPWLMIGGWLASVLLYLRLRDLPRRRRAAAEQGSWRQGLQAMRPILLPVVGITLARALLASALFTFLPTFLIEQGSSLWFAGISLSVLQVAGMIGALAGGSLSDKLGRRLILFVSTVTAPLLTFLFLGVEGWVRLPVLLLLGVTGPSTRAVLLALVQESCPSNRALANGIYLGQAFVAESGSAVVVGFLGDLFGLRVAFATGAVILLLGLSFVPLLPRKASAELLE